MMRQYGLIAKAIDQVITVVATDDSTPYALDAAVEQKAKALGFTIGEMQTDAPRGLARMASRIEKWRNINPTDYDRLDGVVMYADHEAVIVVFK
jgi:hypothetical protein